MISSMSVNNSSWADDSYELLADLRVGLRVLVLGPGETNRKKLFQKRQTVIQALQDASKGDDDVCTCEDLFRQQPQPPIELGYAELAHIDQADVVIALVLASPSRQGGVYRELEIIAPYPDYRQKVVIFLPTQKSYLNRFQAGSLQLYREEQKIGLSWQDLMECQQLRQICINRVEEERRQRMYNRFFARIRARGHLLREK